MNRWIQAIRPKTLIAVISPIVIGTTFAYTLNETFSFSALIGILLAGLSIQILANLINDLYDFLHGIDTSKRIGPLRVCQAGLVSAKEMKIAIWIVFFLGFLATLFLAIKSNCWSIIPFYLLATILSYAYSAGPLPLASIGGIPDLLVLIAFGPIATFFSYYLQVKFTQIEANLFTLSTLIYGLSPGLFSLALLAANNLRDEQEDAKANKKTLVVRCGQTFGMIECTIGILLPYVIFIHQLTLLSLPFSLYICYGIWKEKAFATLLPKIALLMAIYTILVAVAGFAITHLDSILG